jgi:predicted secreted hydrolase
MRRAALLALAALASCSAGPEWAYDPDREEGVHADVEVEWWYHFGWLSDEDGGDWAWVSSFFRYKDETLPQSRYLLYDLIDLKTGKSSYRSRLGAEAIAAFTAATGISKLPAPHDLLPGRPLENGGDPLRLVYDSDRFERTGHRVYRLRVGDVDLELRATSEPLPVEGTGLTGIERREDMHYYTIPRLDAAGTVRGRKAKGLFWYDHQWGRSWIGPKIGWSWWGLQLEDGTAVNAYVLRDITDGRVLRSVLTHDQRPYPMEAKPVEWWESRSKVRYPVAWELAAGPLRLRVDALFKDRELPLLSETGQLWEGPVRVTGSHSGRGFQELVSYAREQRTRK